MGLISSLFGKKKKKEESKRPLPSQSYGGYSSKSNDDSNSIVPDANISFPSWYNDSPSSQPSTDNSSFEGFGGGSSGGGGASGDWGSSSSGSSYDSGPSSSDSGSSYDSSSSSSSSFD